MLQNQESSEKTSAEIQYTALKTIFSFSRRPEWWSFQKKSRWNMIFLVLSRKVIFPENIILPPDGKWKMIFLKKYKEIWYLLQMLRKNGLFKKNHWYMIFLVLSGKVVFFPKNMIFFPRTENETKSFSRNTWKDDIFYVHVQVLQTWRDAPLAKKIKDDLIPQK